MNHKLITGAILLFAVSACSKSKIATLTVPPVVDFGDVQVNEVRATNFIVENDSDVPVIVGEIATSCACTSMKLEGSRSLLPHSHREATARIDFGSMIGLHETRITFIYDANDGKTIKKVYLYKVG